MYKNEQNVTKNIPMETTPPEQRDKQENVINFLLCHSNKVSVNKL